MSQKTLFDHRYIFNSLVFVEAECTIVTWKYHYFITLASTECYCL